MLEFFRKWRGRQVAVVGLCLAAELSGAQLASDPTRDAIESEFQAAMTAQDQGDLGLAESLLIDLHKNHPGIFAVDESLGLLYVARKEITEALPLLEAATREEPASDVAHANLGAAYSTLYRDQEALGEFQRAARLNPANAETQQALGQLWMETHQPERAAEAFAMALAHKPGDFSILLNRALALHEAGQNTQAAEILISLPGADQSAEAQSLLGDVKENLGGYKEAAQHYARAAELEPAEARVWMLGVEFLRHWTFDAAIREFEAASAKFPQSVRMRLGLGAAYFGNASYTKAVPVFADLLEMDPDNGLYAAMLGQSCTALSGEASPRCSALLAFTQAHPGNADIATFAAATIVEGTATDEQIGKARKLLEAAIADDPKLAQAQYEMGVLMQNEADWAGSVPYLEAAIALKPDFAKAHYRLALAYWRSGHKKEGEEEMELEKKYRQRQQDDMDQHLRQITTFLVDMRN